MSKTEDRPRLIYWRIAEYTKWPNFGPEDPSRLVSSPPDPKPILAELEGFSEHRDYSFKESSAAAPGDAINQLVERLDDQTAPSPSLLIDVTALSNDVFRALLCGRAAILFAAQQIQEKYKLRSKAIPSGRPRNTSCDPNFTVPELSPSWLLGFAMVVAARGWPCAIVASVDETVDGVDTRTALEFLAGKIEQRTFGFWFVESTPKKLRDALVLLNAVHCLGAGNLELPHYFQRNASDLPSWGAFHIPSLRDTVEQWLHEEFEYRDVLERVLDICRQLMEWSGTPSEAIDDEAVFSAVSTRLFLYAISTSRRIARRRFENCPCEANILLTHDPRRAGKLWDRQRDFPLGKAVYHFSGGEELGGSTAPSWFHWASEQLISQDIELALLRNSCLTVSMKDGRVHEMRELQQGLGAGRRRSFLQLTSGDSSLPDVMAICCYEHEYVEVYANGELALWYDGYWKVRPFQKLKADLLTLLDAMSTERSGRWEMIQRIELAIGRCMDRSESSLLAFVRSDQDSVDLRVSEMRNVKPVRYELVTRVISELGFEILSSILRMDGAHFFAVNSDGIEIQQIAQFVVPEGEDHQRLSLAPGTGRRAAMDLAGRIRPPGFVVKVSSSGDLHIFPGRSPKVP